MVHFRDTDPRPLPEPERRPVSQHYARAVERTGDTEPRQRPKPTEPVTLWMSREIAQRLTPEVRMAGWREMIRKAGFEGHAYLPLPVYDEMTNAVGIELHPL